MMEKGDGEWLSPEWIADDLDVPIRSFYAWRQKGQGPRAVRVGKHLRIRRRDYEAWLAERRDTAASTPK
jgi:hypothetical protein